MSNQNRLVIGRDKTTKQLAYYDGKGHLLTIAPARSGKLVSSIAPNVFFHTGSLFAVDPKGEIAHAFARVRSEGHRQQTYFLNPARLLGLPCHAVNPLAWLTPDSETLASDAANIADILIEQETGSNSHFSDEAANLILGLILYCALDPDIPDEMRNLIGVRRLIEKSGTAQKTLFQSMRKSEFSAVRAVASMIGSKSDNERAAVFSTARRNTHFLGDKAIQTALAGGNCFDLRDLKRENISVFLLIPPKYLGAWRKWYRLMVACAINAMMQTDIPTPDIQALFVLDELYALGRLDSIAIAAGLMPGMGLRLQLVMQSLSQLESRYEDIHEDLIANSGAVQAFNISNPKDARFVQSMMPQRPVGVGAGGAPQYEPAERLDQIMYTGGERVFVRVQGQQPKWYDKLVYYEAPELRQHPYYRFVNDTPLK